MISAKSFSLHGAVGFSFAPFPTPRFEGNYNSTAALCAPFYRTLILTLTIERLGRNLAAVGLYKHIGP